MEGLKPKVDEFVPRALNFHIGIARQIVPACFPETEALRIWKKSYEQDFGVPLYLAGHGSADGRHDRSQGRGLSLSVFLCHTLSHTHTHTLSLSLSLLQDTVSLIGGTITHSLSPSLSHTHARALSRSLCISLSLSLALTHTLSAGILEADPAVTGGKVFIQGRRGWRSRPGGTAPTGRH